MLCFDLICLFSVTYMTPVEHLIGDSPSQCIIEVSSLLDHDDEMGGDWRQLWSELLHSSPNEAVIRQQREGPTIILLKAWCQMNPLYTATVGELVNMLNAVNRSDIAVIIEKYCQVRIFIQRLLVSQKDCEESLACYTGILSCKDNSRFVWSQHLKSL